MLSLSCRSASAAQVTCSPASCSCCEIPQSCSCESSPPPPRCPAGGPAYVPRPCICTSRRQSLSVGSGGSCRWQSALPNNISQVLDPEFSLDSVTIHECQRQRTGGEDGGDDEEDAGEVAGGRERIIASCCVVACAATRSEEDRGSRSIVEWVVTWGGGCCHCN